MTRTYKKNRSERKNIKSFRDLTEQQKDDILLFIQENESSIKNAAFELNISVDTINKIFTERFGKRTATDPENMYSRKDYHKKYWQKNKLN